ncbi:MAG: hypothetical protein GX862_00120 [Leucobacter sp.]|nr:hypothetical protein [Leucobacter sp.]
MERMSEQKKHSALERVLAYATVAIIVIAVVAYLTTLIVAMVAGREILADGLWTIVTYISYWGLPIGFVLLMVLLGINFRRRGREQ